MSKNYTILIVCEGQNTEPNFFKSIRDKIIDKEYDIGDVKITISPIPKNDDNENVDSPVKHKEERIKRTTKVLDDEIEEEIKEVSGPHPLNWVLTAQSKLKDGTYDEAWAVFDHDNHPARKEAFEEAAQPVDGKYVNIAFTSRSFEYYLLLHFERIFNKFDYTDCKIIIGDKKKLTYCGTNLHPESDCNGSLCINGYAQTKNYWKNEKSDNTKDNKSTFPLIHDKLIVGFENSAWLRYKSNIEQGDLEIYDRNPYVSTDKLVKRLTGNDNNWKWVSHNSTVSVNKAEITIGVKVLSFKNIDTRSFIIKQNSFTIVENGSRIIFGKQILVNPNKTVTFNIDNQCTDAWCIFSHEEHKIMFYIEDK